MEENTFSYSIISFCHYVVGCLSLFYLAPSLRLCSFVNQLLHSILFFAFVSIDCCLWPGSCPLSLWSYLKHAFKRCIESFDDCWMDNLDTIFAQSAGASKSHSFFNTLFTWSQQG